MQELKTGDIVTGILEDERDYGFLFRTDSGIVGRLPRDEFTWIRPRLERISFPRVGTEMTEKVTEVKPRRHAPGSFVTFSARALSPNPWDVVEKVYPVGTRIQSRISGFASAGAILNLPAGLSILIHNTEVSWKNSDVEAKDEFAFGQLIEVIVIESSKETLNKSNFAVSRCVAFAA